MFKIGKYILDRPVMLAPMEEVTDVSYRIICREMGADVVFSEFINADGLVKGNSKGKRNGFSKMKFLEEERPIAIQIYGNEINNMEKSAILAEKENPDFIDINAGCWVKKISSRGAGAGLLKDPIFMQKMIKQIVESISLPITVKTRLGWDESSINIVEVAQRLEDVGVKALTVHCRTRYEGHTGKPKWEMVKKIKDKVSIPIFLNGGIMNAKDAIRALNTPCDGIMIARGAIGTPWIFREIKELLTYGRIINSISLEERVEICLKHLRSYIKLKTESVGVRSFRKFYSGYLKGFPEIAKLRVELMQLQNYLEVKEKIMTYVKHVS